VRTRCGCCTPKWWVSVEYSPIVPTMSPATALSLARVTQGRSEQTQESLTNSTAAMIDELAHDLRQPLSAIEHLVFLLQMNATDCKADTYIEQIQDLIEQANRVLDKARATVPCTSV
jgi:nitrogen-specific signal transduction histidine kinase